MTASSNLLSRSQSAHAVATVHITPARRFFWLVRRELWENRSIYIAPAAVGAVALLGFLVATIHLPAKIRAVSSLDPAKLESVVQQPFVGIALVLMMVDLIIAVFYSLDALYGERRDRSVLFWKSLPVSDFETVLSKASIPILVLPVVTCVVTLATQLIMLLVGSAALAASGMSVGVLWTHVPFLETAATNFYHLVVFHGLWYAPFYGWLLLASAWARRTPFLWAVLPGVAVGVVEKHAFGTSHFVSMLLSRLTGGPQNAPRGGGMTMDMIAMAHPGHFLVSPGMWAGLAITAGFLFVAARLRRSRGIS